MNLLEKLNNDLKESRLKNDPFRVGLISSVLGEAINRAKRTSKDDPTDEDITAVCKSFLKAVRETISIMKNNNVPEDKFFKWEYEEKILLEYYPEGNEVFSEEKTIEIIKKIVSDFPSEVQKYKSGDKKLLGLFVGKTMKESKGKADPKTVMKVLMEELSK